MALYISLEPFAYTDGNEVVHVLEVGRLIEMTTDQAALYPGKIAYWGSGSNYLAPQITMLAYDSTLVFPNVGSTFHVYLDQSTGRLWQWNEVTHEYTLVSVAGSVTPSDVEGVTPTGEALMTSADQAAAREALGFVEAAQDAIAAALSGATGVTVTYNDAANTITISGLADSSSSAENIRDIIGATLVGLGLVNIAVDDANNTITFSTTATANATDAALRDRSTHTGTQPQSSVVNLTTDLGNKVDKVATPNRVYIVDNSGVTTVGSYSSAATASSFALRDSNGNLTASAATLAAHLATKGQMDTALALKLDKVSTASILYGTDGAGAYFGYPILASGSTGSTMVRRTATGQVVAANPVNANEAATKSYTDTADLTKANIVTTASGDLLRSTAIQTHPESTNFDFIPYLMNDVAFNTLRGGSVVATRNGVAETIPNQLWFNPDPTSTNFVATTGSSDVLVFEVTLCQSMTYTTRYGIVFSQAFRAQNVLIEIYDSVAAQWISVATRTGDTEGIAYANSGGGGNGGANPITKMRFTCTNFSVAVGGIRVTSLFAINYASPLLRAAFVDRLGGAIYGPITTTADPASANELSRKAYVDARAPLTALSGFNLGSGTRRLVSSMAKAMAGTGVSEHLIIGDSMSSAYTGAAFDFANSWHRKLKAKLLASGYQDGGTGLIATNEANGGGKDPRWAFSGTADLTSNVYVALGTAASTATFTSDTTGTIVDVAYSNAGGSFSVKIDGAAAVPVVATGALTIGTYTVTGLANTTHTIVITATSGSAIIAAAQVRNTTGVRFSSLGKYGLRASGFLGDGGFVKSIAVAAMPSPDVVHIPIGANDMIGLATAATTVANIQTIRNLWPSSDVILYVEPITENNEITDAAYAVFQTGLRTLANTLGCPLVDWNQRYGGGAAVTAMGFVGPDGVHPNAIAQADMGGVVYEGLMTASVASGAGARVAPRVVVITAGATPTVNSNVADVVVISGLTVAITDMSTNLTGTPNSEDPLRFAITGTASRAIAWGSKFESGAATLPSTTTGTQRLDVGFFWNATTSKWRCMAVASA